MIVTGKITHQVSQKSNDYPLGRWSSFTIGPENHKITIITAYIVCYTPITAKKIIQQLTNSGTGTEKKTPNIPTHAILHYMTYLTTYKTFKTMDEV